MTFRPLLPLLPVLFCALAGCGPSPAPPSDAEVDALAERVYERLYPRISALVEQQLAARKTMPLPSSAAAVEASGPPKTSRDESSPVVMEIDGKGVLTLAEFDRLLLAGNRVGVPRERALEEMVSLLLLEGEARERHFTLPPPLRREVEARTKDTWVHFLILQRSAADGAITEERVRTYYEATKDFYTEEESIRLREILVATRERADELRKQVQQGRASFGHLAGLHSLAPSKERQGDRPPIKPGDVPASFYKSLKQLGHGQVSEPVRDSRGWRIFQMAQILPAKTRPFAEVADEIRKRLLTDQRRRIETALEREARERFKVETHEELLGSSDPGAVIARIDGQPITQSEMTAELMRIPPASRKVFEGATGQAKLFDRYLKRELFARLARQEPTLAHLEGIRKDMERMLLVQRFTFQEILSKIQLTPMDVADFYGRNIKRYRAASGFYLGLERLRVPLPSKDDAKEARARILDYLERARKGEAFSKLASEALRADPAAKDQSIVWHLHSTRIPAALRTIEARLEEGQIWTSPIEHEKSLLLLHLVDRSPYTPLVQVAERVKKELAASRQQEALAEHDRELRKRHRIQLFPERVKTASPSEAPAAPPVPKARTSRRVRDLSIVPIQKGGRKVDEKTPPPIRWNEGGGDS